MRKILNCALIIIVLFANHLAFAQTTDELERRNGFKDIKLTSSVSSYEGLEFKKDLEDDQFPGAQLYVAKKGHYENIGKLKVRDLQVKVYKDSIYQIIVVSDKDPNLYKGLKKIYGEPKYDIRADNYFWNAKTIKLIYESHSKSRMVMTYVSYLMLQKRKQEKKQDVQDVADDF